ncbi:hypothetical protein EP073_04150 [Geovibrio thiophilus]|uniref:Uncharacterized protein n=1 Tax=Geovibrio thiophilus TaxID=139438 RepID=A0A3R5UU92_9BACT|nr:hypothetical protein [Geovibrio thiophilus]QAR32627.1 hypothetical protein EP073_04150 [Geovibrio thiophilus]
MAANTENSVQPETALECLMDRIGEEHGVQDTMYEILAFCSAERTTAEILKHVKELGADSILYSPETLITWLYNAQGLRIVRDEPETVWISSSIGTEAAGRRQNSDRLKSLLEQEAVFNNLYVSILRNCVIPKTKEEIEEIIEPILQAGSTGIYPAYFIGMLEDAGGLRWDSKWHTTENGVKLLTAAAS